MERGSLARAHGVRLFALDEVDSTNNEARRLIESGERGPLWVVAARQTKGRGRMGRDWVSPPGNLHASFIVSDFGESAVAPQLGFVAGVAAIRALDHAAFRRDRLNADKVIGSSSSERVQREKPAPAFSQRAPETAAGQGRFALKWPNDLLLDGAKLGGILLENVSVQTGDARAPVAAVAIIGVGVNCAEAPRDLPYEARALAALGADAPSAETVFAHLSDTLVQTLDLWRRGEGFARLREEWLTYASGLGGEIRVALARETVEGRFETIDATGRLVLATADGPRVIEAGDVLLGPRPTAAGMRA